jgi:hypothetical protein
MSQTDKLISVVYEHKNLISFIDRNFPNVLEAWKNRMAGVDETPDPTEDADTNSRMANSRGDKVS